ncbi:nucleoside hydrolase [Arundinibacter roseus]|uniref:Nucleoside hydrolase n=1 Tax=Arundinibacter roseus TaxID=2070510 RepID=A0A4R4KEU6_9BACT|nr:nucleoside hydrolase [Arundinibacter roseus]TDB65061.1 nucleoside hydrolase [Arundinibacter roseus]
MNFIKTAFLLLILSAGLTHAQSARPAIWLDTDLMIGLPERSPREVDDAVALLMTLRMADKVDLVGVSLVTYVDYGYGVAENMLKWYAPDRTIPVYKGSDLCGDVGVENDASRALAQALRKEKLTIVAIGPATNVATVLKNHPELASQIKEITFCAGRTEKFPFRPGLETLTVSDYNFEKDVDAFKVIFESGVKVILSGFECSAYLFLGKTDLDFLKSGSKGDQWLAAQFAPWMQRGKRIFGVEGFIPYDTTPLGHVTHPEFFKYYRNIPVQINYRENDATTPNAPKGKKAFLEVSYDYPATWTCDYAYKTLPGFEEIVIESLKGNPADSNAH